VTLGATAKTVGFAISNNLTGALVGGEPALYSVLRLLPPVAVGLAVMWGGNKLIEHAQGNKHLDTTAEAIKKINDRLRETPQWWIQRGMTPPKTTTDTILDYLKNLDAQKPRAETKAPPLLRPNPEELKKQAEKVAEEQQKLRDITRELYLRMADDRQAAFVKLEEDYRHINELTKTSVTARNEAKRLADAAYLQTIREINEREREEELKHQRLLGEMEYHEMQERAKRNIKLMREWYLEPVLAQMKAEEEAEKQRLEAERRRKENAQNAMGAGEAIGRAVDLSRRGRIGRTVGLDAQQQLSDVQRIMQDRLNELEGRSHLGMEEIKEVIQLRTELEKLNRINLSPFQRQMLTAAERLQDFTQVPMDPFHQALQGLQDHVIEFAGQAGQAFASFFSDIVSGQEGAGKKLLAAFIGMIGQMLVQQGVLLIQAGIGHVALSHVFPYSLWLRASDGYKAIATGIALAAIGGTMMGASAAMSQSAQSESGSSYQSAAPQQATTSTNQVQVISVGAPRGPQSLGQASAQQQQPQPIELRVKVESKDSHIINVVAKNVNDNGRLRTVIQNA
jgi:hypothetical protein